MSKIRQASVSSNSLLNAPLMVYLAEAVYAKGIHFLLAALLTHVKYDALPKKNPERLSAVVQIKHWNE